MRKVDVSTIGFTKTTAERFFDRIRTAQVRNVMDVRLHNTSQLAGFAKSEDLAFFLKNLCGAEYSHKPILAPTDDMLKAYKKDKGDWRVYENSFLSLMSGRRIEERFKPEVFDQACLLCSEDKPHHCHRRLVVEYLNSKWGSVLSVKHL